MTSTPSEELLSCPFCGGEPYVIEDDRYNRCHVGCDCVAGPRIWQDVGFLSDAIAAWNRRPTSSRREVLEEAARVADEAQATAREEIALEKAEEGYDPYAFGSGFLSGEITASVNIAKAIRALAEEK